MPAAEPARTRVPSTQHLVARRPIPGLFSPLNQRAGGTVPSVAPAPEHLQASDLPAYALSIEQASAQRLAADWPHEVTREWAWGGSRGAPIRR